MLKKLSLTLSIFLLSCIVTPAQSNAMPCSGDSLIVLLPIPGENPGPNGPKSTSLVPITTYVNSSLSTIFFSFSHDLGEIEIDVLNTTTCGFVSEIIDSHFLSAILPITMGSGHYTITLSLPSGQQYLGEFDI